MSTAAGEQAEADLQRALDQHDPLDAMSCIRLGNAYCRLQRYEAAVDAYDRAIALRTPFDASAHYNRGIALQQLGRHGEAVASYDAVLASNPGHAAAHNNRGSSLNELKQYEAAVAAFDRALALQPDNAEAHNNRGNALSSVRQYEAAVAGYDRAIALRPGDPRVLNNRGFALSRLRRYEAAIASYDVAIALAPGYAEVHFNRANLLKELRRFEDALAGYDRSIEINPEFVEAHGNRGIVLHELHRYDAALAGYARAIAIAPGYAAAYCNRSNALRELRRLDAALADCDTAVALDAGLAEAYCNRGAALLELERPQAALADCDRAIELDAGLAEAHFQRGMALRALDRLDEAVDGYTLAIASRENFAAAYCNRGIALYELRRFGAALADCGRAIELEPDFAEARFNRSLIRLITGDWDLGWPEYEWRRKCKRGPNEGEARDLARPLWLGREPIDGKTMLLHCEQGLGDTLQFCRYVERVADLGARVILEVQEPLAELLSTLRGVSQLIAKGASLPDFDCHCPLLSLPLAFGTTLGSVPAPGRYLRGDPAKIAQWRTRLGEKTRPRIGLAWSGNPKNSLDRHRSLALAELMAELPPGCDYFCLQNSVRESDEPALAAHPHLSRFPDDSGFAATAALCELMDAVVSADTSVAHLSAALGKNTSILVPFKSDWRWLLDRDDSPWYPTVKLYRQQRTGDWSGVLRKVGADLDAAFEWPPAAPAR